MVTELQQLKADHGRRVQELLEANNRDVERRRALRRALNRIRHMSEEDLVVSVTDAAIKADDDRGRSGT